MPLQPQPEAGGANEWVAIAEIRKPVGLDGTVALTLCGETFANLKVPCPVSLIREGRTRSMIVAEIWSDPRGWFCRFEGINDRDAAEALRDSAIVIPDSKLKKSRGNRFYHFELEGMVVRSDAGNELGKVVEVHNYPTVDALEVSDGKTHIVIPMTKEAISSIDRENGIVVVNSAMIEELL
jgi:16S rRNA processing protein RimM